MDVALHRDGVRRRAVRIGYAQTKRRANGRRASRGTHRQIAWTDRTASCRLGAAHTHRERRGRLRGVTLRHFTFIWRARACGVWRGSGWPVGWRGARRPAQRLLIVNSFAFFDSNYPEFCQLAACKGQSVGVPLSRYWLTPHPSAHTGLRPATLRIATACDASGTHRHRTRRGGGGSERITRASLARRRAFDTKPLERSVMRVQRCVVAAL